MLFSFLLVTVFAGSISAGDDIGSILPPTRRIFYGDIARIKKYPYYAALINCGAVILSDTWVATAAHCVLTEKDRHQQYVFVGGNTIRESIRVSYNEFIIHQHYKVTSGGLMNDIALLKLTAPLQFSATVQPVKLPTSVPQTAVVVGRGRDENGRETTSLMEAHLQVLSSDECSKLKPRFVENSLLCAKPEGHIVPHVCNGDSGGPVLSGNTLLGLVSFGLGSCEEAKVSFHTNILKFLPWITYHTGIKVLSMK